MEEREQIAESILVLDEDSIDLAHTGESVSRQFPLAFVTLVNTIQNLRQVIQDKSFDIVILSHSLTVPGSLELIHELKLKESEPGVLYLARESEPKLIAELYNAGCDKCILKEGAWTAELGPSIRHLFRLRRLQDQNMKLLAKLTEANLLLEDKNKRLDEFSATIAHDIRGPLGGIVMKLDYIIQSCEAAIGERHTMLLKRAFDSAERLTGIVQAMYEFAKIGSIASQMCEVNLSVLIGEVLSDLHFDDTLDIKIGVDDLPIVWGSPELLRRVFINLIVNAVKYNDKKEVVVNVGLKRIMDRSLAPFCEVFVEDNGKGIPENELGDVFRMFARGSSSGEDTNGTGLGLAVVRRIVELHHGKIGVRSKVGEGTKFILSLPMEKIDILG